MEETASGSVLWPDGAATPVMRTSEVELVRGLMGHSESVLQEEGTWCGCAEGTQFTLCQLYIPPTPIFLQCQSCPQEPPSSTIPSLLTGRLGPGFCSCFSKHRTRGHFFSKDHKTPSESLHPSYVNMFSIWKCLDMLTVSSATQGHFGLFLGFSCGAVEGASGERSPV